MSDLHQREGELRHRGRGSNEDDPHFIRRDEASVQHGRADPPVAQARAMPTNHAYSPSDIRALLNAFYTRVNPGSSMHKDVHASLGCTAASIAFANATILM